METPSYSATNKKTAMPIALYKLYRWVPLLEKIVVEKTLLEPSGHDFYHALRVANLCLIIADKGSDTEVLIAAAFLHDIARHNEQVMNKRSDYHITKGVQIAETLLRKINYPLSKIDLVLKCIKEHEAEGSDTIECQILQDADRLDAMGAIGIARCFTYGGKINRPIWCPTETKETWKPGVQNSSSIAHLHARILGLAKKMNTKKGKQMAKTRFQFMMQFISQFNAELEGSSVFKR